MKVQGSIPTENINNPAIVYGANSQHGPVAKFIVPYWGDKVDSGIGLSYLPATARLPRLAGRYDNLVPESNILARIHKTTLSLNTKTVNNFLFL
jgi:hypothetical protein